MSSNIIYVYMKVSYIWYTIYYTLYYIIYVIWLYVPSFNFNFFFLPSLGGLPCRTTVMLYRQEADRECETVCCSAGATGRGGGHRSTTVFTEPASPPPQLIPRN